MPARTLMERGRDYFFMYFLTTDKNINLKNPNEKKSLGFRTTLFIAVSHPLKGKKKEPALSVILAKVTFVYIGRGADFSVSD